MREFQICFAQWLDHNAAGNADSSSISMLEEPALFEEPKRVNAT
jgi:hypothetical protein